MVANGRGGMPQSGFGLIELMISMVLGLLVLGAAIAVFQSNQRTYNANEGLNRIQENSRVAFELMSRDIRAAGGAACSSLARPNVEHTNTAQENAFLNTPVNDPGTGVTLTSGDDTSYRVDSATTTSVTLASGQFATGTDATDAFKVNDWIVVCNANQIYVVKATSVGASTIGFAPATEIALTTDPLAPKATVTVSRYRSNRWYVATNPRGGNSLFVSRNGAAGEEVADGVQSLQVRYLENRAEPFCAKGTSYNATPTAWGCISGVRLEMLLQGQNVDGTALQRSVSNVVSLRSRAL